MRLLVIDFDSFFPVVEPPDEGWPLYDWGHSERWHPSLLDSLWVSRAVTFVRNGMALPRTSGLERTFWSRFQIHSRAAYYVSDSNVWSIAPQVRRGVTDVVLFDAHHDCGYKETLADRYSCEDWGLWYIAHGIPLTVYYPQWRKHVFTTEEFCYGERALYPPTRTFDDNAQHGTIGRIHACRSGAWVPPWCEAAFWRFVRACPARQQPRYLGPLAKRPWASKQIQHQVNQWQALERALSPDKEA
jgi:hypothetical protein